MESRLLFDLALILFATKIFGLLTRRFHLPQVTGALLAGIILGPALFGIVMPSGVLSAIAELGVILLLFEAGLETNLTELRKSFKSLLFISAIGVSLAIAGGFALAYCFGQNIMESFFVGVILMASSIGITVEVLHEMGKLKSKTGSVILGVSAVEDIFTVMVFSIFIGISDGGASFYAVSMIILKMFIFFVLASVCGFGIFKLFE